MGMAHYRGSCQCGAVSFEADVDLDRTIVCNCSRCKRLGSVLAFTAREAFTLTSGEENLSEYLFNNRTVHHLFCRTCGIQGFAYGDKPDGASMVAINVNCLEGVDPRALASHAHDGASA
ncbi:GFA family protein [Rhizobium sp. TRM96647]|uniref:GFA family protein n=1 Tax=unclassified Rhizobium TaxID=2613769 RepID=UPI0021E812B1|nr:MULTISPECIES: GFA family protein [unclassified Rhizobium]MCV3738346.1 GFA family protein [Rhizobium sp. TRM96647]MCV3759905.1 GFA family protein [Rhizobium sp. TRM96650]